MTTDVSGSPYAATSDEITDDEFARASVPDLGQLMKQAVDRGLISPVKSYSDSAAAAIRARMGQQP
jgi:hypothetical protein